MLIQELVPRNFRIYGGEHRFNLAPRMRYGKTRPIILFGGLNGAGKTSLLTGLRLALYGRSAIEDSSSQKDYEAYLAKSIHRSKVTDRRANEASIELNFTYAKLGVESAFKVIRSWRLSGKSLKESLEISENGEPIRGLTYDQAQNFLNELIPIGVSALFFFDGEKIKDLADDTGGTALEQSIKKLLGLDIIERLSGDLTVLHRNIAKSSARDEIDKLISSETASLNNLRASIEKIRSEISTQMAVKAESDSKLNQLKRAFDEKGGHFSSSRKDIEREIDQTTATKSELIAEISILLADATPLSLSGDFSDRVLDQIETDLESSPFKNTDSIAKSLSKSINSKLKADLNKATLQKISGLINDTLKDLSSRQKYTIHDLTPVQASGIMAAFSKARDQKSLATALFERLQQVEDKLDELGAMIARAPDDDLIRTEFENLQKAQAEV